MRGERGGAVQRVITKTWRCEESAACMCQERMVSVYLQERERQQRDACMCERECPNQYVRVEIVEERGARESRPCVLERRGSVCERDRQRCSVRVCRE